MKIKGKKQVFLISRKGIVISVHGVIYSLLSCDCVNMFKLQSERHNFLLMSHYNYVVMSLVRTRLCAVGFKIKSLSSESGALPGIFKGEGGHTVPM